MSTEMTKRFADRLSDLIVGSGMQVKALAKEIGISYGALSQYQNDRAAPGLDAICKIANYFHISVDDLLGIKQDKSYFDAMLSAQTTIGLSPDAFSCFYKINSESPLQMQIMNSIITSKELADVLYDIFQARRYRSEIIRLGSKLNRLDNHIENGFEDADYLSSIIDAPEEYGYASVPMEEACDFYLNHAAKIFGQIISSIIDESIKKAASGAHNTKDG